MHFIYKEGKNSKKNTASKSTTPLAQYTETPRARRSLSTFLEPARAAPSQLFPSTWPPFTRQRTIYTLISQLQLNIHENARKVPPAATQ